MIVEGRIKIPYRWTAGRAGDRFLAESEQGRVVGLRCGSCGRVSVPPRERCVRCRALCTEWLPVGPEGTVVTWARQLALVRLDGADTSLLGRMREPSTGLRVRWTRDGFEPVGGRASVPVVPEPRDIRWTPCGVKVLGAATLEGGSDLNYMEMAFEVVQAVLKKTGLTHDRVDTIISASSDFWDGRTISDIAIQDAAGAAGKSESKVSMDGAFALIYAAARIASGRHRTCLVVAHAKASEGDPRAISAAAYDPVFERPLGMDDGIALEMQARRVYEPRGLAVDLHTAPLADGACAMLLAAEGDGPTLDSFACWTGAHGLGERELGIANLPALNATSPASAAQALLYGHAMRPLPGFATGLMRVAETTDGIAHGQTGATGQAHCLWKVRR